MYIENYKALLSCIITPNKPNVDYAIKMLTGRDVSHQYKDKWQQTDIKLTDLLTNEVIIFKSQKEVNDYLGVKYGTVAKYLNSGQIYKKRYLFERVDTQ